MSKQRRVNTAFWDDPYIEKLSYNERYFFLFLITNPHTTIAGIYEISVKKMSFYTGLKTDQIEKFLSKLIKDKKVLYIRNYIFMVNAIRHQMLSEKIVAGIKNIVEALPFDISSCVSITNHRVSIDFDSLSNLHIDINININKDVIEEKDNNSNSVYVSANQPTADFVCDYMLAYCGDKEFKVTAERVKMIADKFHNHYSSKDCDWTYMKGGTKKTKMKDWKSKARDWILREVGER